MEERYLTITNRRLEQYLYNLCIECVKKGKTEDLMTYWTYKRTPEFETAFSSFKEMMAKEALARAKAKAAS